MIDTLLFPFQFPFMQNAFWVVLLVAPPAALLSCFLVLKGWALMGDAVSHAVLPGVVLAWSTGIPLIIGAFAAGMSCALLTGYLSHNSRVKQDTVMGVVFSGMFGIGIIITFPLIAHASWRAYKDFNPRPKPSAKEVEARLAEKNHA